MGIAQSLVPSPEAWLARSRTDEPVLFYCPERLAALASEFLTGFPGLVSYAVKANPRPELVQGLVTAGVRAFDVASPAEMALVRDLCPDAVLHYHNPVRSRAEIAQGIRHGCTSWSVDRASELDKLRVLPKGTEIAVRLKLPVSGAAYDFGAKFGASPEAATALLARVAALGYRPSLTFHPGTQCPSPEPWERYIAESARIAQAAGVRLHRLNVGGGFPSHRSAKTPDLTAIFAAIGRAARTAFGTQAPALVCEPGRALCAEAMILALRVKAVEPGAVFLNDGIYGGMAEWRDIAPMDRVRVITPDGAPRAAAPAPRIVFGPTCDSIDRLPAPLALPATIAEDDYVIFEGMGAYSHALATAFNGYGVRLVVRMTSPG